LLDGAAFDPSKLRDVPVELPVPDNRVSAITPASAQLWRQSGVWDLIDPRRIKAFSHMQVWDSQGPGCMQFDSSAPTDSSTSSDSNPLPALGYIVENNQSLRALQLRVAALCAQGSPIDVLDSTVVDDLRLGPGAAQSQSHPSVDSASAASDSVDKNQPADDWVQLTLRDKQGQRSKARCRLLVS
jgi:2-polyprenyl-6-methoxyphenol hydroxylase-like FAD-dependent oxidoreductase